MLADAKVVIILQYISVLNQLVAYLKFTQCWTSYLNEDGKIICFISFVLHECLSLEILGNNYY